jgi:hypothetical protein
MTCGYYNRNDTKLSCKAYPDGIPDPIVYDTVDHHFPYKGDHGIQYKTNEEVEHDEELSKVFTSPVLKELIEKFGTPEGLKRAWDERGRGRHPKDEPTTDRQPAQEDTQNASRKAPKGQETPKSKSPRDLSQSAQKLIEGLPDDPKKITHEQYMKQATIADIHEDMKTELTKLVSGTDVTRKMKKVAGPMTPDAANDIINNAKLKSQMYENYYCGQTNRLMRDHIDRLDKLIKDPAFKDIKSEDLNVFVQDTIDKMTYQEIQSNRNSFTDHGIRHLEGNMERQETMMKALGDLDPKEKLMSIAIMVNHDIGYDTPVVRAGGVRGIVATGQHPEMSANIFEGERNDWNKDKIFSSKEFDRMKEIIRTHDSPLLDKKDVLATSTRLSDNLALFSTEKLPSVFEYVQNGAEHLESMGEAAKTNDIKAFTAQRSQLWADIDADTRLSDNLKRDLKSATASIDNMTPKFSLGTLAGEISDISKNKSGGLNIEIDYNKFDSFLQNHFDMGQKQTKKLLETYGETDFTKDEYDLGDFVHIKINRPKEDSPDKQKSEKK